MPARGKNKVKLARMASRQKKGEKPANYSPEAAKMESSMGQDELCKVASKPESTSLPRLYKTPKK
jgi:hypothetical protein